MARLYDCSVCGAEVTVRSGAAVPTHCPTCDAPGTLAPRFAFRTNVENFSQHPTLSRVLDKAHTRKP